ncbi:MAG: Phycocyanobilin:ferredoxin oxidoreductase [Cyanobacteriota bacterium]|jgi:phycocyanobilin:ferredoxin oxidoreductase
MVSVGAGVDCQANSLVEKIAAALRPQWSDLPELAELPLSAELQEIRGELEGDAMEIRNELLRCRGLRKIHLETAHVGRNLDILHCVMFPDPCFDLPLFGADIVASRGVVSAAIVDLSPSGESLPEALAQGLAALPRHPYSQPREVPAWGAIFSPQVLFVRPSPGEEEDWFLEDVIRFQKLFIAAVANCPADPPSHPASQKRFEGQLHYCQQQRRNDKTRRVLEVAFDKEWADNYINNLLFDDPLPPGIPHAS